MITTLQLDYEIPHRHVKEICTWALSGAHTIYETENLEARQTKNLEEAD